MGTYLNQVWTYEVTPRFLVVNYAGEFVMWGAFLLAVLSWVDPTPALALIMLAKLVLGVLNDKHRTSHEPTDIHTGES